MWRPFSDYNNVVVRRQLRLGHTLPVRGTWRQGERVGENAANTNTILRDCQIL